jgi:hypothetical protein
MSVPHEMPGSVIRLSEQGQDPDGAFRVQVKFGEDAEYEVRVTGPAGEGVEDNLAWYFEQHLRFPFLDTDREREAVRQIAAYGESLFTQVFGGEASHPYRLLRDRAFDNCRLEVSGSAALHRLHWESLRDPDVDRPLALRLPITRRVPRTPLTKKARDRSWAVRYPHRHEYELLPKWRVAGAPGQPCAGQAFA